MTHSWNQWTISIIVEVKLLLSDLDLEYDIDGLVFILYDKDRNVIDKFAYKFESFSVETTLLDVEYDFSPKSGIYTMGLYRRNISR